MSDIVALALTLVLAVGVLIWGLWIIWRLVANRGVRHGAANHVLGVTTGTVALGVVLPPVLMGILDPFRVWLIYALLSIAAATLLGWRWNELESQNGHRLALAITAGVFMSVLAIAGIAVT